MMNPFTDVNWSPGTAEKRKFAVSLMIGCPILAAFFSAVLWFGRQALNPSLCWVALLGLALGAVLWCVPAIAQPFYVVWYFIACCFGFVIGNALLIAFYYLIITPLGLGLRLFGVLSLRKGFDRSAATYWQDSQKRVDPQSYYRQF